MKNIHFTISKEMVKSYPQLRIGVIEGKNLSNSKVGNELKEMTRTMESKIRERFTTQDIVEHSHIRVWRETYKSFGVKPKKHRPTCEALIRRVFKGEHIPLINTIVNCYLFTEIEFFLPCGGYDINKIEGNLYLRYSKGDEEFIPIGGKDKEFTKPREIVYADDNKILTRRWNYRDSDFTKITLETKNIILMVEAPFNDVSTESLQKFLKRLSKLLTKFCGGSIGSSIINTTEKRAI